MFFYISMILLIPAFLFGLWAQMKVKSTFERYSHVKSTSEITGAQLAQKLLSSNNLSNIRITHIGGNLSDHYDPGKKLVALSDATYSSDSVASLGVVAHEIGHAIQHKNHYAPLKIRNAFVPVAQFGSSFSWIIFFVGLLFSTPILINVGIWLFLAVVIFSIITLPVEFNASNRALSMIKNQHILDSKEQVMAKKVLDAAAMTYVASTLMAISQLLRMIFISRRN
ncbi:MAG: zinc metallopeptidase [Thermotogota bacterium]|nr:zinc metallopeptidase [Thermotogota bacterium]